MSKIIGANANIGGSIRKGAWTGEEDNLLRNCIHKHGEGRWHRVPQIAGLNRCRKSCRLRWFNYLKPNIKRGQFSEDEVDLIIRLHKLLGNKWTLIAGRIPGRTANDVKNYWNTHLRQKISPLSLPPKHPNTFSGPKSKNNTMHMHPQIIRPRPLVLRKMSPLVINKPDPLSSLCQSNGLENGATKLTVTRDHLAEEEEEDDKDDGKAKWWENMFEVYENGENEEGIIGLQQFNGPIDGQKPTSSIQVQELNVWEEDNIWNFFDVNMWE